ncbi:gas vesicle protein K [Fictibacillus enclensis]|uniref:gas vesicle protein K n=1 Tax=Fictibacillus TaxID=1329200 RepID=UPI000815EB39|nr:MULTISPECIES: gas vesicle protein K [Fictibacillus]MDM5197389.1 gas vesicle protein K [Fictibacillus enclensis]MDM5336545.1 gas vesicle protein K [Fictibacillus enclensis]WHY72997.1 gas vesicle protein K [Fictibacillus enclensis]SCC34070.1 Gas vesicle protein K [Fictibacillus enclensis]
MERLSLDKSDVEQGLAKLVLTIIELLRQLMERQAMRKVENDSLSDDQLEELGLTLMRLEEKMLELKVIFGLEHEDLNIELGPLGKLL